MFVHVVKKGETLSQIAPLYKGTSEQIQAFNGGMADPLPLGMALLIPGGPPSGLAAIPQDASHSPTPYHRSIPEHVLRAVNGGNPPHLYPVLLQEKPMIESHAILSIGDRGLDALERLRRFSKATSSCSVEASLPGEEPLVGIGLPMHVYISKKNWTPATKWSSTLDAFTSIQRAGYRGVVLDLEHMIEDDTEYLQALERFREMTNQLGLQLAVTVRPTANVQLQIKRQSSFEYIATHADRVMMSTEAWLWGLRPKKQSSYSNLEQLLQVATQVVAPEKLWMDVPIYAMDLALGSQTDVQFVGLDAVHSLIREHQSHIHFDYTLGKANLSYRTEEGQWRRIWYEDARSMLLRVTLIAKYRVRGVSARMLNYSNPYFWNVFATTCQIHK